MREERMMMAASSYPHDRRPLRPAGSGSGRKLDKAMMKLVDKITENTGMQDQLQSAVQEGAKPRFTFCQWMGAELSFIDANMWSSFQREAFDLVARYCDLQQPGPPPPPPLPMALPIPPMPPQQQIQHQPLPMSAPPTESPSFQHLTPPAAWQPGPGDYPPPILAGRPSPSSSTPVG